MSADYFTQEVSSGQNRMDEDTPIRLNGESLAEYAELIQLMVDHNNDFIGDLAGYIPINWYAALARKVISIVPSVEVVGGQLMCCTTVRMREPLVRPEINQLRQYLKGQFTYGWGKSCEKDGINVNKGVLHVHFGDRDLFHITINRYPKFKHSLAADYPTISQRLTLRIDRTDEDINIFSAFALAFRMLNQCGQIDQAKEMSSRILASGSFDAALTIVEEYMYVLDIQPVQQVQPSKPKSKGDDAR